MYNVGGWKTNGRKSISNPESGLWLHHLERSAAQCCCLSSVRRQTSSYFTWLQTKHTEHFVQENSIISSMKWKSESHRTVEAGGHFWRLHSPTLLHTAGVINSRLLRAISTWGLDIPRYLDCAKSLHHLFQCLITFAEKMFLSCFSEICLISACAHPLTEMSLAFFSPVPLSRHLCTSVRSPLSLLYSRVNTQLSRPFLVWQTLQSLHHLHGPLLDMLQ